MQQKYPKIENRILNSFKEVFTPSFQEKSNTLIKCATPLIVEYEKNKKSFSLESQKIIESYLTRSRNKFVVNYLSPSGKFVLNYQNSGSNAVPQTDANSNTIPDYVENVATYFDYSYQQLVDSLELKNPINGTYSISFRIYE